MKRLSSPCSFIVFGAFISSTWGCGSSANAPNGSGETDGSIIAGDSEASGDHSSDHTATASTTALSRLSGRVTDIGSGSPKLGLAGAGTLASASAVRIVELVDGGKLSVLAQGTLDATGSYSVEIPTHAAIVIAQAVDARGSVLGSVIARASASDAGELVVAAPICTESSLEAAALIELSGCQSACAQHSFTELMAMVDAQLATALSAVAKAGGSAELQDVITALAKATVAAEGARAAAFADAGVRIDHDVLAEGKLEALTKLNTALASSISLDTATADFLARLDAAWQAAGAVSAQVRATAQAAASASFRASLSASLGAETSAVLFAAIHASAKLEARATAAAMAELVAASDAGQAVVDASAKACAQLLVDVDAAASADALEQAKADFVAAISASVSASATGTVSAVLGSVTSKAQGSVQALLTTTADLSAKLEAELAAAASALGGAELCVAGDADGSAAAAKNVTATADLVIAAYAKFAASMQALAPDLVGCTTKEAELITDALTTAESMLCLP